VRAQPDLGERRITLPRSDLQMAMGRYASVVRDADGLRTLTEALQSASPAPMHGRAAFEDAALTATAQAVAAAASERTESRGCHHRSDHPDADPARGLSSTVRLRGGRVTVDQPEGVC